MEEQQSLLSRRGTDEEEEENSSEEWTESSTGSYYSDSESSVPEWESSLDEKTGQLIYIDCHPIVTQNITEVETKATAFTKTQNRKSTRSKFLRLIRRRESKRRSKRYHKNLESTETNNKVTFQDFQEGEIKEVLLKLDNAKTNRKGPLVETVLGLTISPFSDGTRVMISGFTLNSEAKKEKSIKIGDWLKKINGIEVNYQDINQIIEHLYSNEILLELQRVAGVEVTKDPPTNELTNQSKFVRQLTHFDNEENERLNNILCEEQVGILFINTEQLTENGPEYEGVIYCYPSPHEQNKLCAARGVFITINHLLNEVTKTKPRITSLNLIGNHSHVTYRTIASKLLLLMLPSNRISKEEMLLLTEELLRILNFTHSTIEKCFETDPNELDHFFSRFFTRILCSGLWSTAEQYVALTDVPVKSKETAPWQFEESLLGAVQLKLPDEAQVQIDDALFELEASDYREWNDEPLDCQRLFTILGSSLYHSGYLLATHFVHEDLIDVHTYCRQYGLFHLSRTEPLRTLVIWREVFPFSCNNTLFNAPNGKRYLLVVGSGKDLLTCIMEAGGCTEPPEDNLGPDAFYVEEVQATLAHLQELGISELAERCLQNAANQIVIPESNAQKKKSDLLGTITFSRSTTNLNKVTTSKKPEVTSILKRRSSDQGQLLHVGSSISIHDEYDLQSEDSTSQGGYSERSEVSDEPVLGRRHMRERKHLMDSDEEDSDFDDYGDLSQVSGSSYDLNELRQALLNDSNDLQPLKITAGSDNVLFHYVHFDAMRGIIVCPPDNSDNSKLYDNILDNFKKCCQSIRDLFQNTIRFKNMAAEEMAKSVINKSLIAIKEYGILFECNLSQDTNRRPTKITYWVIGRLFYEPHPRELYVCYQDSIPQNLVEIAFKLGSALSC